MIQDFKIEQSNLGQYDFIINSDLKDFESVNGLETAIISQAFTDKRSTSFDVAEPRKRQGWIGDIFTRNDRFEIGSFVYLKNQSRNTDSDNNETAEYVKNSLNNLIRTGAIKSVEVQIIGNEIYIKITNKNNEISRYSKLWRNTLNAINN